MKSRLEWRKFFSSILEKKIIEAIIQWIVSKVTWLAAGPWGWVLNKVLEIGWATVGDRFVRWGIRKSLLLIDKQDGKIKYRKYLKSVEEDNDEDYWDVMSDA